MYVFMYLTYKHHLGRVLSVEGSKLECFGKKGFEIRSFFFFWTEECSLKRLLSEPQASVPSLVLETVRLSEL